MNKAILPVLLGVLLATAPSSLFGQQKAGDFELQFFGTYFRTVGNDVVIGSGTIGGKIGPYITNRLQIGIGPTLTLTTVTLPTSNYYYDPITGDPVLVKGTETTTSKTFGTSAFIVYSFLTSGAKFVPYLGAQWFKSDFNHPISEEPGAAGINVGIKYFFARKTALDLSSNYLWDLDPEIKGGVIYFSFGLSFLF